MESDSVIFGLLGRIHVLMRRVANRITDVEYMRVSKDYAREIVRLAGTTGNDELVELCARLREAMELDPPPQAEAAPESDAPPVTEATPEADKPARSGLLERLRTARPAATHPVDRYVGSLR